MSALPWADRGGRREARAGVPAVSCRTRPYPAAQLDAETGPIFLHQAACERYQSAALPAWFAYLAPAMVRGYGDDDWIRYETGDVVPGAELTSACRSMLGDPTIAYVHVRSKFGCFQCRVDRG